ncbi:unnamed protein product [Rotaria sordida]|uniref:C2H2-type domain-containing protein n=2 Tax=Rotaria sordida TaxID=392033 RepID=A0A815GIF7_9BILA|nr:unnamed protein product [Rotaria sordida]CAF3956546.1 unnamed protein product [Rotaria sordida]
MSTTNSEDLFICGKCHANFTDLNIFLTHRSICVSEQRTNLCPITSCPLSTLVSGELETFIDDISPNLPSTSDSLYESNPSGTEIDLLSPTSVEQVITSNETVDRNISDSINYSSIENGMSEMNILECPVCDEQFEAPTVLENHVFEHSTWIPKDDNTSTKSGLSINYASSSYNDVIDGSLECKQCAVTFDSNASLSIHKKMFHGLNPVFRCSNETCSQVFEKPVDYILHARIHSQKRLTDSRRLSQNNTYHRRLRRIYRCKICKKLFQTSDQLQYHMQYETHTFLCQLCPAEFESSNSYHNHLAKHSNLALYHCTICTKAFQKRADLSGHIIAEHNKDVPQQKTCSICKLTFTTRFHLNRHNVTKHSNIKPFKCKQDGCEQAFARKDKLKQHEAKHSVSDRTYKCDACTKTFIRPEHLRDHNIARHSHQYPFSCEYCRKGFLYQNQLYDHHKQYHSYGNQMRNEKSTYDRDQSSNDQTDLFLQTQ